MKKIIGLLGVVLVAILASYFGMGVLTEYAIKKNIQAASQFGTSVVEVTQYKRSWFHSTAVIQIHFGEQISPNQQANPTHVTDEAVTLDIPTEIYHGPVIFTGGKVHFGYGYALGKLSLPNALFEKMSSQFTAQPNPPALNLEIMVGYLGESTLSIAIPPFQLAEKEGAGKVEWNGFNGDIAVSRDMESVNGNINLKSLTLLQKAFTVKLNALNSHYRIHKEKVGLYVGTADVVIPSLFVAQDNQTIFDLSQFNFATDSSIAEGLFQSKAKVSLTKLVLNGATYGESEIEASLRNLDAIVLSSLNEQAKKLKYAKGAERQKILFSMLPEFPKLLSKGPVLEVSKLSITMPEGSMRGSVKVALPEIASLNPFQILQKIDGMGQFQVPEQVIKRVLVESLREKNTTESSLMSLEKKEESLKMEKGASPKDRAKALPVASKVMSEEQLQAEATHELAALVQANLLIQRGNEYAIEFEFSNGVLKVNGHAFDPSKFKL